MQNRLVLLGPVSLTGPTGQPLRRASQQRRLALLALVATSPDASISRDRLLGLLWPDRDESTARHLLADSLYVLRQALGDDAIVATGEAVRLSARLRTDVTDFTHALTEERWGDALALYRGDFLDGFFVRNAADFDQWAITQRHRLRGLATSAASTWARELERAGRTDEAVAAAERALSLAPLDEAVFRDLIQLLVRNGNRARAESIARSFAQRLEEELGVSPSVETMRLLRAARSRAHTVDATTASIIAQGRYHWHQRTPDGVRRAIAYFTRAVERDAKAADAWCGLADAWSVMGGRGYAPAAIAIERAAEYAGRALAIDDTSAAAHISLGGVNIVRRGWHDAVASLRRAIALDPDNADAHHWLALALLTGFGDRDGAVRAQTTAAALNPVSSILVASLGWQRYFRGEYTLARSILEPAVDLSVEIEEASTGLARVSARLGDETTVNSAFAAGFTRRSQSRGDLIAEQAAAFAMLGDKRRARRFAVEAKASGALPIHVAIAWASLGDVDRAMEEFERESFRIYWTPHVLWWDPLFEPVRDDRRCALLRERAARTWSPEFV